LQVPAPRTQSDSRLPTPDSRLPKYFICAMDKIFLGIPAQWTERVISVTRIQDAIRETENQETFISLPALLKQKDRTAPHGIVLKPTAGQTAKTTLLTPKIDAELEIPEEEIHGLPRVMSRAYRYFKGAYCTGKKIILILNPEKILEGAL